MSISIKVKVQLSIILMYIFIILIATFLLISPQTKELEIDYQDSITIQSASSNYTIIPLEKNFPRRKHLRWIGRCIKGIVKWRRIESWYNCGKAYKTKEEIQKRAMLVCWHMSKASYETKINPWGLLGTSVHESGLDMCATSKPVRDWGIKYKFLKKSKYTISHPRENITNLLFSDIWKRKSKIADLGPFQLLNIFYPGDFQDLMTLNPGIEIAAQEMKARRSQYRNISSKKFKKRPWRRWRGSELQWYDDKVTRKARMLGAKPGEI